MIEFLRSVVKNYSNEDRLKCLFVFPNRRSEVFFQRYLSEELRAEGQKAAFIPQMTTISDLFSDLYEEGTLSDKIDLLLELYEVYAANYKGERVDTIDEFIFWGDVILNDFNDVDKYKADPEQIFTNISDLKDLEGDYSFLSPEQRTALEKLIGSLKIKNGEKKYHKEFLKIWNILLPVYKGFNKVLKEKRMAYEGMVFRSIADRLQKESALGMIQEVYPDTEKVVFVGLNALTECEKDLLTALDKQQAAEFWWDYPQGGEEWLNDPFNKSSFFLKDNVEKYQNKYDEKIVTQPKINVVTVASDIAQAKLLPNIIEHLGEDFNPERTVVVLPDEGLLNPVLTSIPDSVETVNITMGYPLTNTQAFTLIQDICSLFDVKKSGYFYHRPVWNILCSSLFADTLSQEDAARVTAVKKDARTYIKAAELDFCDIFHLPCSTDIDAVCVYLRDIVDDIARKTSFQRERQALFEIYKCINKLRSKNLNLKFSTFRSLLLSLISTISLPFKGEPVEGLQIMGPLEIRALDFDNVIILSSMEGVFPRKSVSNSFIPYIIRKAFNLPTYEYQDAVWAYYFYRMIRRAKNVWMVYDNVPSGLLSGEPSRYILQLQYGYGADIRFWNASAEAGVRYEHNEIDKHSLSPDEAKRLNEMVFSASALQDYLQCPLMFYFKHILKVGEKNEVEEDPQANQIGNVVHNTMESLYRGKDCMSKTYLESLLKDFDKVKKVAATIFKEEFRVEDISGKHILAFHTIQIYLRKILEEDKRLLEEKGKEEFRIIGLELKLSATLQEKYKLKGFIDRLDSFEDDSVRVVDYKTGKFEEEEIAPKEDTATKLFEGAKNTNWPKIALQIWIYDYLLKNSREHYNGECIFNAVYSPRKIAQDKKCTEAPLIPEFYDECVKRTVSLIEEIRNLDLKFSPEVGCKACGYCPYISLCKK
ncbi:MAG: PD-(D/E)XK nuclease family protein [Bacteroidales bacterium]|nr:PD-(D/E)XK nuclease family protein [Bacteroidales bacterium]